MGEGRDGRATLKDIFTVARDRTLTSEEKALWVIYRSYETVDCGARPGDELLAAHLQKSPRSVRRYRATLLERGYLEQQLHGPNPATYRAVVPDHPTRPDAEDSADKEAVFPSRKIVAEVLEHWWLTNGVPGADGTRYVPAGAPDGYSEGADLNYLLPLWKRHKTETVLHYIRGVRLLVDQGEFDGVEPGTRFTGALVRKLEDEGGPTLWDRALDAYARAKTEAAEAAEGRAGFEGLAEEVLAGMERPE